LENLEITNLTTNLSNPIFWRDRPTLVTGGTGLVGSWLVRRLLDHGANVVCLVRDWVPQSEFVRSGLIERVRVVRGDVRDQACLERTLAEYEVNTVLHLAAQAIVTIANRNPISTFETNVAGTWCLLEACRRNPTVKQIVVASSDKAYGDQEKLPYDETAPLQGLYPYDVSKSCADLIARSFAVTFGVPVAITRCGNFYGGGDLNWNRIVPGTIRSVVRGERPVIRSDGNFVRDYFYVEDGAAAYMLLAERLAQDPSLRGEAFNFSNELRITVKELVERLLELMESDLQPEILNETSNEIRIQYLSAEKARQRLDWSSLFTLDEGLRRAVRWYRDFLGDSGTHQSVAASRPSTARNGRHSIARAEETGETLGIESPGKP
jgi:CDP-glucose 4,6-dehydratase